MKTLAICAASAALLLLGCVSRPGFVEGTTFECGLYLPYEGSIYGMEIVSYVNGCRVVCPTNQSFEVERKHCSTNSYFFGMFQTNERSETKVKRLAE